MTAATDMTMVRTDPGGAIPDRVGPRVVIAGALPPPRNGMAMVTGYVLSLLQQRDLVLEFQDLAVPPESGRWGRHLVKLGKVLSAAGLLLRHRGTQGRILYLPCDANSGKIYGLFLCLVARVMGYPVYLHHHSYFYINQYSPLMNLIVRAMGRRGRHLALCTCMAEDFRARYGGALNGELQVDVVHNRLWYPRREPDRLPRGEQITIGHFGNLTWEKGAGVFLDLFEALRARGVNARAILLGNARDEALNAKIRDVASRNGSHFQHIEYPEPVPRIKDGFFRDIDFFVMPTQYKVEAQPLVLIEARVMGVPVIATDRGCIRDDHEGGANLIVASDADFVQVAGDWIAERRFEAGGVPPASDDNLDPGREAFIRLFSDASQTSTTSPSRGVVS